MSKRILPLLGSLSPPGRWPTLPLLAIAATACLAGGAALVWSGHPSDAPGSWGSAALLLILAAAIQLRVVLIVWRRGRLANQADTRFFATPGTGGAVSATCSDNPSHSVGRVSPRALIARLEASAEFWRWLLVGTTGCYAMALAVGPRPDVAYLFAAAVVIWYTLLLLPLAASREALQKLQNLRGRRLPRRIGRVVYLSVLLLVSAELSLRALWTLRDHLSPVLAGLTPMASQARADMPEAGLFHVTFVGNPAALESTSQTDFLNHLESLVPGSVIDHVPSAIDLSDGSRQLAAEAATHPCDLVLMCVSVGDDLADVERPASAFDWRQLALARMIAAPPGAERTFAQDTQTDQAGFERSCQGQLTICRTPIDPAMQRQWKRVFAGLDEFVEQCRQRQIAVALVVVPGEFQVNRALCDTLRRRLGYGPQDLDLELPQRRLAAYAESRRVPVVDLLSHLRLCDSSPYERNKTSWNDEGRSAAARAISGWLQSRYGGLISATAQK